MCRVCMSVCEYVGVCVYVCVRLFILCLFHFIGKASPDCAKQ